jgi:hypothetical protein
LKRIEDYNSVERGTTPFDSTIMFHLLKQKKKISLNVVNSEVDNQQVLKIDVDITENIEGKKDWEQFREEISWLIERVEAI